ncbi:cysteine synthase A [Blautia pseudococcoides]|uniref:cysteine synthase A n=1 Tax=Blautia pseudococcoides TaxID=1796616 RepID=UPI00148B1783|nr:cysteine synthase A [Blautia pseudococcoides]QJU16086.1 cysteine synthase A [Blautia pseudococcoides]
MENIKKSASQLIGNTPLLELCNYEKKYGLPAHVIAKLEYFNPAGSAKDRVGLRMIEKAEQEGKLKPGATIIEPTSGNTGIGIASVAAAKGYHAILTMPETMSVERQKLLRAYGAEVVLTDGKKGMQGSIEKAEELKRTIPGSVIMGQFDNEANPEAHETATGPEIYRDTDGRVDIFVATVGTGGTLTGTGRYLKKQNPGIRIVAVEPAESPLLSGGQAGAHGIQGIGANFIPGILDRDIYDEIICVTTEDAYKTGNDIAKCEGILVGISSGAAVWAAAQLAWRPENKGKNIVTLLPDTGDHYLSTTMYD